MRKKYLISLLVVIFATYFFSCSSGNKLRFYQPVKQNLIGVRKVVIAPCAGTEDASLLCAVLESAIKKTNYFQLFDKNKFESVLEQYNLTFDLLFQADTTSKLGKLLNVDALAFANLKKLEIFPTEKGTDRVEKMVWTGEYERDETGEIIEEVTAQGKTVKKKKFKFQPVDQGYQIRTGKISAEFRLIDLKKGSVIYSQELAGDYNSGKIIHDEGQTIPTNDTVKRQLILQISRRFINEISP